MADNKRIIKNIQEKTVAQVLSETESTTFKDLKRQAKKLIKIINNYFYKDFHKQTLKEQISEIIGNFHTNEYHLLYQQIYNFEETFNSFLGRKIFLTYVDSQGNIIVADSTSAKQMYEGVGSDLRITASKKNEQRNINKLTQIQIQEIKQSLEEASFNKRLVFTDAIRRWEKPAGQIEDNPNNMEYKIKINAGSGYNTFYWFPEGRKRLDILKYSKIVNRGHIAQAYADAVMNRSSISNDTLEKSLEILNNDFLQKQSNIAIAKGDVVWNVVSDGRIQFAVKGNSASAATFGPYLAFAEYISALKESLTRESLQKKLDYILQNNITVPQKIFDYLVLQGEETLYKYMDSYKRKLT